MRPVFVFLKKNGVNVWTSTQEIKEGGGDMVQVNLDVKYIFV